LSARLHLLIQKLSRHLFLGLNLISRAMEVQPTTDPKFTFGFEEWFRAQASVYLFPPVTAERIERNVERVRANAHMVSSPWMWWLHDLVLCTDMPLDDPHFQAAIRMLLVALGAVADAAPVTWPVPLCLPAIETALRHIRDRRASYLDALDRWASPEHRMQDSKEAPLCLDAALQSKGVVMFLLQSPWCWAARADGRGGVPFIVTQPLHCCRIGNSPGSKDVGDDMAGRDTKGVIGNPLYGVHSLEQTTTHALAFHCWRHNEYRAVDGVDAFLEGHDTHVIQWWRHLSSGLEPLAQWLLSSPQSAAAQTRREVVARFILDHVAEQSRAKLYADAAPANILRWVARLCLEHTPMLMRHDAFRREMHALQLRDAEMCL
jgi:hypothetical protein